MSEATQQNNSNAEPSGDGSADRGRYVSYKTMVESVRNLFK